MEQLRKAKVFSEYSFKCDCCDSWARFVQRPQRVVRGIPVAWRRPACPFVKLNTNVSVTQGRAYGGGLLRDHEGHLIFAFYKELGEIDVLLAKSLSLLHGLQLCKDKRVDNLLVEVDSENLVRLIADKSVSKWPFCNVLRGICTLLRGFSSSITHIFRKANSSVDKLAEMQSASDLFCTSLQELPGVRRATIRLDSLEYSFLCMQVARG